MKQPLRRRALVRLRLRFLTETSWLPPFIAFDLCSLRGLVIRSQLRQSLDSPLPAAHSFEQNNYDDYPLCANLRSSTLVKRERFGAKGRPDSPLAPLTPPPHRNKSDG